MLSQRPIARLAVVVMLGMCAPAVCRGEAPADPLLKLVPRDSALTIAVEDLRGHVRSFAGSPLAAGFRKLPTVRDWLGSERARRWRLALRKVESILGEQLSTVRDELLGEAFVLTLRLPPGGKPEAARGLLLLRVPNRPLLDRLIDGLNAAQLKSGELQRVNERERDGAKYFIREFQAARRPTEYYATLNDRVFVWSNSEELIQGAIDRQVDATGGLAALPDFQSVRERLPGRAVVSLFVDPRVVERLLAASPKPQKPDDERALELLGRALSAVRYAGAAVEWNNGIILHAEEIIETGALDPGLKRWAARTDVPDSTFRRVPPSAILMATVDVETGVLLDALACLVPERDRPRLETVGVALNGLLLGLDARSEVAPELGPGMLFYVERPDPQGDTKGLPWALSIGLARSETGTKAASAIDNALRSLLALHALDEHHGGGRLRVESRKSSGATISALNESSPFAYAFGDGRLVLGASPAAVARSLTASAEPRASGRVDRVRSAYFPDAVSFALADLRAIHTFADRRRPALAALLATRQHRTESEAARDLDQVLALIDLFDAAFFTSRMTSDFSGAHQSLGLVRVSASRP